MKTIYIFASITLGANIAFADVIPSNNATESTIKANNKVLNELPFSDKKDFELAQKNLIAKEGNVVIKDNKGRVVWSLVGYKFLDPNSSPPDTVNPSLWRQAVLNMYHG
ncbi:MAG: hypothetical protein COB66_05905, partial [Coxiella sp. (in: Bacteria)]